VGSTFTECLLIGKLSSFFLRPHLLSSQREKEPMPRTSNRSPRSVVHAMFCIERTYQASPAQVFKALTDPSHAMAATVEWDSDIARPRLSWCGRRDWEERDS